MCVYAYKQRIESKHENRLTAESLGPLPNWKLILLRYHLLQSHVLKTHVKQVVQITYLAS